MPLRWPRPAIFRCIDLAGTLGGTRTPAIRWQLSFRATAPDPGGNPPDPDVVIGQAMSEISLTDDAGQSHDLRAEDVRWGRSLDRREQQWHGHVLVARDPASKPAWFELAPTIGGAPGRVALPSPAQIRWDGATRRGRPRPSATWPPSRPSPPSRSEPPAP
jgi:hypothetical protein